MEKHQSVIMLPVAKPTIFVCHASEDKPVVRELCRQLAQDGFNPWLDEERLLGGQDWQAEITRAVRQAEVVLVCLSRNSMTKRGFVQKEIRVALDTAEEFPDDRIFIIPYRLTNCAIPSRLERWHALDHFRPGGYRLLIRTLRECLDKYPEASTSATVPTSGSQPLSEYVGREVLMKFMGELLTLNAPAYSEVFKELIDALEQLRAKPTAASAEQVCQASHGAIARLVDIHDCSSQQSGAYASELVPTLRQCVESLAQLPDHENGDPYTTQVRNVIDRVQEIVKSEPHSI